MRKSAAEAKLVATTDAASVTDRTFSIDFLLMMRFSS
jgi:hypothetical protein